MAIRTVITRGFGNATFNGTIPLVSLRGYANSVVVTVDGPYLVVGRGIYVPGASDRNVFTPGAMTAERQGIFTPGAADKEVRS